MERRAVNGMVSVVIPSYNGEALLPELCLAADRFLSGAGRSRREIIVVLDGSTDRSLERLEELSDAGRVRVLRLKKRSGQLQATLCGLSFARGDIIITMDDDFQHLPETLGPMLGAADEGCDLVFAVPGRSGGEGRARGVRALGGELRTRFFRRAAGCGGDVVPSSFRLVTRAVLEPLLADPSGCCYLSVELARAAKRVKTIVSGTERPDTPPGEEKRPSRHRFRSLAASLFMLALYLPPFPSALRRLAGGPRWKAETILVVGAGKGQLGLIRRCRRKGLAVAVSDRDSSAPGRDAADYFLAADTFDPEATAAALERARAGGLSVDAVATAGTDQPVLSVARVAELFSLPGALPYPTALAVTNKRVMKARFSELGLPVLPWALAGTGDRGALPDHIPFPAVIKPVDSQGQRGIFLVPSEEELFEALPRTLACSREQKALVEPYYPSSEMTFSGWVHRGRLFPLLLTDRATMESGRHIGICPAHRYPSRFLSRDGGEVLSICRRFTEGFGIREGAVYIQLLKGERGIVINEAACRIGGAYEELLVPALAGADILDLQIELSLTGTLSEESEAALERASEHWPPPGYASVILAFTREGTVSSSGPEEALLGIPGVAAAGYLLGKGARVGAMENSTNRAAWGVIIGEDREEVNLAVERFYETLELISDTGENLVLDLRGSALHPPEE